MKNTANTANKPVVTIGSTVCYRTKAGSYNKAVVKDIVDSEFGKQVILTSNSRDGGSIEFKKLLKNVWVYTGRKADAEAAEPALAAGDEVFYLTKSGRVNNGTVIAVDGETVTVHIAAFGGKDIQQNLNNLHRSREVCEQAKQDVAA